jgi:single-strand DNA-binding protein
MTDMNSITMTGNTGSDIDVREFGEGKKVGSFNLAVQAYGKGEKTTTWFRVVVWNKQHIDFMERFIGKGSKILIQGTLKINEYTKEEVTQRSPEIHLDAFNSTVQLLVSKEPTGDIVEKRSEAIEESMDDEIPF